MTRNTRTYRKSSRRNEHGTLAAVLMSSVVLAGVLIGSVAVDPYHMQAVRSQLQAATDAAALAGAQDLFSNPNSAESDALTLAAANKADGRSVSNSSAGTTVTVAVTQPGAGSEGEVQVTASMQVSHLFAPVFGRRSDVVTVSSTAGRSSTLQRVFAGQATLPLAPSWTAPSDDGQSLSQKKAGDQISFTVDSNNFTNAGWSSMTPGSPDANLVNGMISYVAQANVHGNSGNSNSWTPTPAVWVGENIGMMNGNLGINLSQPNNQAGQALIGETVTLAVTDGTPPLNQTSTVLGFIGFTIDSITFSKGNKNNGQVLKIRGTLTQTLALGTDMPGAPQQPAGITSFSIGPVQLIQ